MTALYNEIDPKAAAWLRESIQQGHIAPGIVDERSIEDLDPDYLRQFVQVHFFAGIGVWSYALRRAGWRDDEPVWTGSCPCQPFSAAGKGAGFADERHLWPAFHWLIEQCRPDVVLGEQVASKDGLAWLDLVSSDLEASGYAAGAADTCAAGFGAPHIRQRLYWCALADADNSGLEGRGQPRRRRAGELVAGPGGLAGGLALPDDAFWRTDLPRRDVSDGPDAGWAQGSGDAGTGGGSGQLQGLDNSAGPRHIGTVSGAESAARDEARLCLFGEGRGPGGMADAAIVGRERGRPGEARLEPGEIERPERLCDAGRAGPTNGQWRDADWLFCRDGKWRPVEPGTFPLAHGASARVGRLRGYGNAIVAPQAQAFVEAVREWRAASDLC